jgi:glycosyltransferase involved in cell wall biosynthesis
MNAPPPVLPSATEGQPLVSVVTVCRNAEHAIGPTIASVLGQSYPRLEQIIVDGASTDGTMGVVERARASERWGGDRIARVISEPDTGVYHAMNKGVGLASGDLLLFLNAGDTLLYPDTVAAAVGAIGRAAPGDVYHAGVVWFDPASGRSTTKRVNRVTRRGLYRGSLPHQGMFFRRDAFARVGPYDEGFRIVGDYEWCLRAFLRHGCGFIPLDALISVYPEGGLSSGDRGDGRELRGEYERARAMHFGAWDAARCRAWIRASKILGV